MAPSGDILAATDGSARAAAAVRWAGEVAAATGVGVTVVHCPPPGTSVTADDPVVTSWTRPAGLAGAPTDARVLPGDPRERIPELARELDSELVVVASRGEGGFDDLGLGKVAEHLIHDVDRPLAVVPRGGAAVRGGSIVTGIDGSDANRPAVEWAARLAGRTGGALEAVFVHDPVADTYPHGPEANWKYQGQRGAEQLAATVAESTSVPIEVHNRGGNTVTTLATVADEQDAAMIVIGTRGHWTFGGRRVGHVATQLPGHSDVPVVIVPH